MERLILLILFAICLNAFNLGEETSQGVTSSKEKSLQQKSTIEKREQKGNKKSISNTKSKEILAQQSWKNTWQLNKSNAIEITTNITNIFRDIMINFEKQNKQPFGICSVFTNPLLPKDFGLTSQINSYTVSNTKAQWLQEMASSNAYIKDVSGNWADKKIKTYRDCLAYYGLIGGQAILYLNNDLPQIAKVRKDKEGNRIVKGIGLEDLRLLAKAEIIRAMKKVTSPFLKSYYYKAINDTSYCKLDGTLNKVVCGVSSLTLTSNPQLTIAGITYFSPNSFGGLTGNYKINANFSYISAIDDLKSISNIKRKAIEFNKYIDKLISKGKGKEAIQLLKKAYSRAVNSKAGLNFGKDLLNFK